MTSADPPSPTPRSRRLPWLVASPASAPAVSRLWWFTAPVMFGLVSWLIFLAAQPAQYVTLSPGGARPVESLVTVKALPNGPKIDAEKADPDLLYLTVSVRDATGLLAVLGVLDDKVEVVPRRLIYGTNQTSDDNRRLNLALMTDSQDKARKVALERLGYEVKSTPVGAFVEDIDPTYPVADVMKPGATITGIDGHRVKTRDELVMRIQAHRPGQYLRVRFVPLGATDPVTARVRLGRRKEDPAKPVLGVTPVDRFVSTFPVSVKIDTQQVGGPSAGLAFTLAILDRLTPGSLLGPDRVAVTGTIELDGTVGPVGGVNHKTEAAIEQGAKLMIVPPDEYQEARKTAHGRLDVEQAGSLDQALAILHRHGGAPLPDRPTS